MCSDPTYKDPDLLSFFRAPLSVREAVFTVIRRPLRSLLILQAIIWGSAAVVFPQALYRGSREAALTGTEEFATDRIIVSSPEDAVFDSWDGIRVLKEAVPKIGFATGVAVEKRSGRTVIGTDREFIAARRHVLTDGSRNFTGFEIETGAPVCILEAQAAATLFPEDNAVGRTVELSGKSYAVIGVLKPLPRSVLNTNIHGVQKDHSLSFVSSLILSELGVQPPRMHWISTEQNILVPWKKVHDRPARLIIRAEPETIPKVLEQIEQFFALAGGKVLLYSNPLLTGLLAPEIKDMLALSSDIFLICLFMGIVVIANVMLISVNERKIEIAIRRCEGARISDIVSQFVIETGIFCTAGALIGIPAGIAFAWLRSSLDPAVLLSWTVPWDYAILTFIYVFLGGLAAGLAPAWRAARLDPVEVFSNG